LIRYCSLVFLDSTKKSEEQEYEEHSIRKSYKQRYMLVCRTAPNNSEFHSHLIWSGGDHGAATMQTWALLVGIEG
jgi:hypothetical protein